MEKAICADPQLSAIDALVAEAFTGFEPAFGGDKRKIARALIADRNACGQDAACIVSAQNNALQTYGNAPSWVQDYNIALIGKKALDTAARHPGSPDHRLPSSIGQCALTHITALTTRLGDDPLETAGPEAGSLARFSNGGAGVSYEREPGLASSKAGDPVVMCLISIPEGLSAGRRARAGLLRRRPHDKRHMGFAGFATSMRRRLKICRKALLDALLRRSAFDG
ncbi:lysozyme inhibitor LprI family protein [Mesorhizobium sp. M0029]|uniref:lysozyme inhibitor LprI family protein n=1 Tax=Mesorhizobium sp. M0029 TaxID=2956850 RepID=UPI0033383A2C